MTFYDLNDTVVIAVTVRNAAGSPVDPTGIVLTLTDPTGVVTTPTPQKTATGQYQHAFTPQVAGQWSAVWKSTNPDAAYSEVVNVRPVERMLISLEAGRQHLNMISSDHDEEVREFIIVATQLIEDLIGPVLPTTVTEHHEGGRHVVPLNVRAHQVTGVTMHPGGPVPAADGENRGWRLEEGNRAIALYTGEYPSRWASRVVVTFQAGWGPSVPPKIRQATRELLRHLWDTQRGTLVSRGRDPEQYIPGQGFTLPRRVVELLPMVPGVA